MPDKSNKRILVYIATFLLVLIIVSFVTPLIFKVADEKMLSVLNLFLGMIATHLLNILKDASGFEFGDSKGSQAKSEAAAQANQVTAAALGAATQTISTMAVGAVEPAKKEEVT